jgi:hypothetical protein
VYDVDLQRVGLAGKFIDYGLPVPPVPPPLPPPPQENITAPVPPPPVPVPVIAPIITQTTVKVSTASDAYTDYIVWIVVAMCGLIAVLVFIVIVVKYCCKKKQVHPFKGVPDGEQSKEITDRYLHPSEKSNEKAYIYNPQ